MKKLLTAAAVVLLAVPAFAQDDIILTGADIDSLLGGGGGRGGNRGGGRGNTGAPDPVMMYDQLKDLLKTKKVPLEKNQEKPLQTLLNNEAKAIQAFVDEQFGNRGQDNRGGRGNNNFMTQIDSVIVKHNGELLTQIKPVLTPDQLALLEKAEKDKKACTIMLDVMNPQQFNNNNRGDFPQELANRPRCTSQNSTTAQRVAVLGDMLNKGKKPLTADQQTKITALVEARFPVIQEEMRAAGLPVDQLFQNRNNNNQGQPNPQQLTNNIVNTIMSQLGVPNNNNNNQNRGNRGGNPGGNPANPAQAGTPNNPAQAGNFDNRGGNRGGQPGQQGQQGQQGNRGNNFNPQQEIQRRTDEILDKVIVSLKPDQQPVVKKFKYDIIKQRGPLDRVRAILEEEGTPLTPEQTTTVQALFNSQNQAIRNFAQQLVQTEVEALPPSAFQPAPQPNQNQNQNQNRNNNNNQNNVNQNPAAQQVVSKVLPQVSVRKALLEKATIDSIMKVLTPAQVASYKLNSL